MSMGSVPPFFTDVARLHRQGISKGFLSTLGDNFLALLYHAVAQCPYSVVLTASEEEESPSVLNPGGTSGEQRPLIGFVAATTNIRRMYRWILVRFGWKFVLLLINKLSRPADLKKIAETLLYSQGKSRSVQPESTAPAEDVVPNQTDSPGRLHYFPPTAELLSIAVDSRMRGAGVGKALVGEMENWFRSRGVDEYKVVTLASDTRANAFYRACGCRTLRDFYHHGHVMREYVGRAGEHHQTETGRETENGPALDAGLHVNSPLLSGPGRYFKRLFDVMVSFVGLVVFLIPGAVIAALVKYTSAGPVFYLQKRIGRRAIPFTVIKFRTMYTGTDHQGTITTAHDSRITPLGRFLRRWKLDEVPQLLNVLTGSMSFVGPRPDVAGYADRLEGESRLILELRPGITGPATLFFRNEEEILASVDDARRYNDEVIWPRKVEMNCEYLKNWSFRTDMGYLLETLTGAFTRNGHPTDSSGIPQSGRF